MTVRMARSRIKASFICPCVGVGGADALMLSLVKHAYNIDWRGIAVSMGITKTMMRWLDNYHDFSVPVHNIASSWQYPGLHHHSDFANAVYAACKDSDIIISWCQHGLGDLTKTLDIPVIEYVQNEDGYAKQVADENESTTSFKAACSQSVAKIFKDKDVEVIYNGIDPSRVTPRKGREIQRKCWDLNENHKVVVFAGRLVKEKRPEDLIRVIQALPSNYIGIYVGQGDMQPELYNLASSFCPNRIAFVKPKFHLGDIFAMADVFMLPSDFEGHPLALMEAMLAGVPTVYSDFTVMHELHEIFGDIGIMTPKGLNTEDLVDAIKLATSDDEEQRMRVARARQMVWENFTISTIANHWEDYLERCLSQWRRKERLFEIHPVSPRKPYKKV
jgi:glycosyltransferase involved in cell wall biosynthesis